MVKEYIIPNTEKGDIKALAIALVESLRLWW